MKDKSFRGIVSMSMSPTSSPIFSSFAASSSAVSACERTSLFLTANTFPSYLVLRLSYSSLTHLLSSSDFLRISRIWRSSVFLSLPRYYYYWLSNRVLPVCWHAIYAFWNVEYDFEYEMLDYFFLRALHSAVDVIGTLAHRTDRGFQNFINTMIGSR